MIMKVICKIEGKSEKIELFLSEYVRPGTWPRGILLRRKAAAVFIWGVLNSPTVQF